MVDEAVFCRSAPFPERPIPGSKAWPASCRGHAKCQPGGRPVRA